MDDIPNLAWLIWIEKIVNTGNRSTCCAEFVADTLSHTEFEMRQQAWRTFEVHSEYILHVFAPNTLIIWVPLVRHSFLIVFFLDSNFRPEDGNQDAPLYNSYLFQRSKAREKSTTTTTTTTSVPSIYLLFNWKPKNTFTVRSSGGYAMPVTFQPQQHHTF